MFGVRRTPALLLSILCSTILVRRPSLATRIEGLKGFYKGLTAYLIHVTPNICIVFLIYEKFNSSTPTAVAEVAAPVEAVDVLSGAQGRPVSKGSSEGDQKQEEQSSKRSSTRSRWS